MGYNKNALCYTLRAPREVESGYVLELASDSLLAYDRGRVAPLFRKIIAAARKAGLVRKKRGSRPAWGYSRPLKFGELIEVKVENDDAEP